MHYCVWCGVRNTGKVVECSRDRNSGGLCNTDTDHFPLNFRVRVNLI